MSERLLSFMALYGAYVVFLNVVEGPWQRWEKGRVVDNWTWTHLAWGALAKRWGLSMQEISTLATLNEAGEAWIRLTRPDLTFGTPESIENATVDVLSTVAAYSLTPGK